MNGLNEEAEKKFKEEQREAAHDLFIELSMMDKMTPKQIKELGYGTTYIAQSQSDRDRDAAMLNRLRQAMVMAERRASEHLRKHPTPRNTK